MTDDLPELVMVDEVHYLHVGEGSHPGVPCNSSVTTCRAQGIDADGWQCIGCDCWWPKMPEAQQEGIAAMRHMRPVDDEECDE